jgi:hypothetical protein
MKTKNEMLMRELRRIDPLASDDPGQADAGELLTTIMASDPNDGADAGRAGARRGVRARWLVAPAAAGVALVAAVALLGGGSGGDSSLGPLNEVAAAAASQDPPPDSAVRYSKVRFSSIDTAIAGGESWSVYKTEVREEWRSETEPGRLRVAAMAPRFVGPGDKAAWEAAGSPNFLADSSGKTVERTLPSESAAGEEGSALAGLPVDPDALYEELSRRAMETDNSAPPSVRMLLLVGELLQDPGAGPDLRAALFHAAEKIPGIQYFGPTEDEAGRPGAAIGMESDYEGGPARYELIFDPETSEVLATTALSQGPVQFADASPPFPLVSTLFLESRP